MSSARTSNYEAAIGRWMNVDPLAEKYVNFTPYAYVGNNPLIFIDLKGEEIDFSWIYNKNSQNNNVIFHTINIP